MEVGAEDIKKQNFEKIKATFQKSLDKSFQKQYLSKIKDKDNVIIVTRSGREEEEILKFASEEKVDIIVIGTHGRTGLKHVFLGSVAEKTIRHSKVPVFVIPCKEKSGRV
jgi:universal stress protein A